MNAKRSSVWGWFALLVLGCGVDGRTLSLAGVRGKDAGVGADGGAAAPRLVVGPDELDLGWVSTGFPARARIQVSNAGGAPLAAPAVSWASGSDADYTLIQNQCLGDVAPGTSCEVRVQLIPTKPGELLGTLLVESGGAAAEVALTALGQAAGEMILAPATGSFEDFGGVRTGGTAQGVFSISNPTSLASGPLDFKSSRAEFSLLAPDAGDCVPGETSLVDGQGCTVRVAFTPMARGPVEGTLTGVGNGVGSVSLALTGKGLIPAQPFASAPELDFEGVVLGQAAQRSVIFGNQGDEPWSLAGARLEPPAAEGFTLLSSNCGDTALSGTQTCEVQLEFRPGRVGADFAAELVVAAVDEAQSLRSSLRGAGLEPGVLVVAPAAEGENDFGPVLVGEELVRVFTITNPSAQPSGVLSVQGSEGFEVLAPPAEGECVPESTSLVNGESCTVRVRFEPALRETRTGALTVTSPLTAAAGLALSGQGISAALIEVDAELDFGRVLTNAPAERVLTLRNGGDQPLAPPLAEIVAPGATGVAAAAAPAAAGAGGAAGAAVAAQLAAFSVESGCTEPLAFEATCDITVRFAPTAAAPHTANLKLSGESGVESSVLLLGEALLPGVLELAPEEEGGNAFGDVPIGAPATRSFTLTNPNGVPSGAVTITTDDNHFAVKPGTCGALAPDGLVDGAVCSFDVSFTPDGSDEVIANIAIQSPGAGRAGLEVRGRGRAPAKLAGTDKNDMGRVVVGQMPPPAPFVWALKNGGDLATGALVLSNDKPAEFVAGPDTCSGTAVAAGASCQVTFTFRPSAAGPLAAKVALTDPSTQVATKLDLTGTGVVLAGPGEACTSTPECGEGVCSNDRVCCDRACAATCETCAGTGGTCTPQNQQEECGSGVCFGVDSCKLPAGEACGGADGDAQCGDGNCERRLGGSEVEKICCLEDCAAGEQCSADFRCVGASTFGQACGTEQLCTQGVCVPGVSVCCASVDCTAGCGNDGVCSRAATPLGQTGCTGGTCVSGVCTNDRCCPAACTSGCGTDGACLAAPTPLGQKGCTGGTCVSGECTNDQCCTTACPAGCDASGACLLAAGATACTANAQCTTNFCGLGGRCCSGDPTNCASGCDATGACLLAAGATVCTADAQCATNFCGQGGRCCSGDATTCANGCDATGACLVGPGGTPCSDDATCSTALCAIDATSGVGRCCEAGCANGCDTAGKCLNAGDRACDETTAPCAGGTTCVTARQCCADPSCSLGCAADGACIQLGGGPCAAEGQCGAGLFCAVDLGRCCEARCTGGCASDGTCLNAGDRGCNAATPCAGGITCATNGQCCADAGCSLGCTADGACLQVGGGACTADGGQCGAGFFCAADLGRCCEASCTAGCAANGTCLGAGASNCDSTAPCTGGLTCITSAAPPQCCADPSCSRGCTADGATCLLGGGGDACTDDAECQSNLCDIGRCCAELCSAGCDDTGECLVVALEPTQIVLGGTDCNEDNTVCFEGQCASNGQCCNVECPDGCDADGTCVPEPLPNGDPCGASTECASGVCASSRCCDGTQCPFGCDASGGCLGLGETGCDDVTVFCNGFAACIPGVQQCCSAICVNGCTADGTACL